MDYPWSSVAGGYALPPGRRAKWLAASHGLGVFRCADTAEGRRRFIERLDRRAVEEEAARCGVPLPVEEADGRCSHLRRGWYWGTQAFAEKLMVIVERGVQKLRGRASRSAPERRSHDMAQAGEWIARGIAAAGLAREEMRRLPGSDGRKVALARLVWERTTMSQDWIASELGMGSAANVSQQILRDKTGKRRHKLPAPLRSFLESVKI